MKCYLCVSNPINFASFSSDINITINALNVCQLNRQLIKSRHQIRDLLYPIAASIFWALRRKNIMCLIFLSNFFVLISEWLIHVSYVFNKKHTTNFRNSLCTSTGNYSWLVITAYFLYVLHSHVFKMYKVI